jgi:bifunctional DNA-binding transcriptional regulator/antitoxin component of YhaV-PrlF toxin-antitoxin module
MTDSNHHSSTPPDPDPGTTFLIQNQTVTKKYRLNIPHHLQNAYDVSTHDVVHAVVELPSEVMLLADAVVLASAISTRSLQETLSRLKLS